jgi:hypothetical protein
MGQKSRIKKNRQKQLQQTRTQSVSGKTPKSLQGGAIYTNSQTSAAQEVYTEHIRSDIRTICLLLGVVVLLITGAKIVDRQSSLFHDVGREAAQFFKLTK